MSRKPNSMYRQVKGQSNTRRRFMGGVPFSRITQFSMGNRSAEFPITLTLVARDICQIRHLALESARIVANRHLTKTAGPMNYCLKIRIYPHEVLRENKQATGAGADRVSQGMRKSFGKPVGTAARVKRGQYLISVYTSKPHFLNAKKALKKASAKLPTHCSVIIEKGQDIVS